MFKWVSIKARLFALATFTSLLMCVVGFFGLANTQKANNSLRKVYEERVLPIKRLKVIADAYSVGISDTLNKVLTKIITPEMAQQKIDDAEKVIATEWQFMPMHLVQIKKKMNKLRFLILKK